MRRYSKWSKEKIIEKIKDLYQCNTDLSPAYISKTFKTLFSAVISKRYFGSWQEAVKAAGIDYEPFKAASVKARIQKIRKWSPEKVVEEIKKIPERELGFVYRTNLALYYAARREFGSWKNAIAAAGLDYREIKKSAKAT